MQFLLKKILKHIENIKKFKKLILKLINLISYKHNLMMT